MSDDRELYRFKAKDGRIYKIYKIDKNEYITREESPILYSEFDKEFNSFGEAVYHLKKVLKNNFPTDNKDLKHWVTVGRNNWIISKIKRAIKVTFMVIGTIIFILSYISKLIEIGAELNFSEIGAKLFIVITVSLTILYFKFIYDAIRKDG